MRQSPAESRRRYTTLAGELRELRARRAKVRARLVALRTAHATAKAGGVGDGELGAVLAAIASRVEESRALHARIRATRRAMHEAWSKTVLNGR